jgi:hypothetical protein
VLQFIESYTRRSQGILLLMRVQCVQGYKVHVPSFVVDTLGLPQTKRLHLFRFDTRTPQHVATGYSSHGELDLFSKPQKNLVTSMMLNLRSHTSALQSTKVRSCVIICSLQHTSPHELTAFVRSNNILLESCHCIFGNGAVLTSQRTTFLGPKRRSGMKPG